MVEAPSRSAGNTSNCHSHNFVAVAVVAVVYIVRIMAIATVIDNKDKYDSGIVTVRATAITVK